MPSRRENDHLQLRADDAQLSLDPYQGGAVRAYRCGGREVLRAGAADASDPFALASFPMVPYANRIVGGCFQSGVHSVRLRPNWDGDPHPLHGQGWRGHWRVLDSSAAAASLEFQGGGDEWPWRYRAQQRFELSATSLVMSLEVENLSPSPMPAMLGLHPYFPDAARAELHARLPRVWRTDEAALPLEECPTPAAWSFDSGRPIGATPLDHCFSGWDGAAVLRWPDRVLTLRAENCHFLQVYAPAACEFFCLEPQTAATGAIGRGEAPLLQPGERLGMRLRLDCGEP